MKIYTKTGDAGETSLFDNTRVSKADARVDAYGDVDELNAWLGTAGAYLPQDDISAALVQIQRDLFALGSELADPSHRIAGRVEKAHLRPADAERLEQLIDRLEEDLPPLTRFILPGGTGPASLLHVARAVCRRAERRVVGLGTGAVDPLLIIYLNRLSDLLFVMARAVNHRAGMPDAQW